MCACVYVCALSLPFWSPLRPRFLSRSKALVPSLPESYAICGLDFLKEGRKEGITMFLFFVTSQDLD